MDARLILASAALLSASALAQNQAPQQQAAPEQQAAPQQQASADPFAGLYKRVQERLKQLGFYDGPLNGDFGFYTQAALAQFQLSWPLPASGMLDEQTLSTLGVEPAPTRQASAEAATEASAGATAPAQQQPTQQQPAQ